MSQTKLKRAKTSVEKPRAKRPLQKYGTASRTLESNSADIFDFHGDSDEEAQKVMDRRKKVKMREELGTLVPTSETSPGDGARSKGDDIPDDDFLARAAKTSGNEHMPPPISRPNPLKMTQQSSASINPSTFNSTTTLPKSDDSDHLYSSGIFHQQDTHGSVTIPLNSSDWIRGGLSCNLVVADDPTQRELGDASSGYSQYQSKVQISPAMYPADPVDESLQAITGHDTHQAMTTIPAHHDAQFKASLKASQVEHFPRCSRSAELSLPVSNPSSWSINQTTMSKSEKRKLTDDQDHPEGLNSDDIAIGLPKDQYQPRPSKSRSTRANDEIIIPSDYSKRPEAAARKTHKSKRRKTTAFHELIPRHDDNDESENEQPCESNIRAFESDLKKVADNSVREGQDEEDSSKPMVREDLSCSESIPKLGAKKKGRGRPKKAAADDPPEREVEEAKDHNPTAADIPSEKSNTINMTQQRKTRVKANQAQVLMSDEITVESEGELADLDKLLKQPRKVLEETQGNATTPKTATKILASPPQPKLEVPVPETPRKITSNPEKGPDKHSPISSGKVAYRVGLSKRARIAPLLRIVRKG